MNITHSLLFVPNEEAGNGFYPAATAPDPSFDIMPPIPEFCKNNH